MLTNPVLISLALMSLLCLAKINVIVAIPISALAAGYISGMPMGLIMETLIGGIGNQSEMALSYILLGALAVAIGYTGVANILVVKIGEIISDKRKLFVLLLAGIASLSQNLIPVHIAFISILIPPLLVVMNRLKIDRRAVACALTFGLKALYVMIPVGFGLIFHGIISTDLEANGIMIAKTDIWPTLFIPGLDMVLGLLVATFISYRKLRQYEDRPIVGALERVVPKRMGLPQWGALIGALSAFGIQLYSGSLPLGA